MNQCVMCFQDISDKSDKAKYCSDKCRKSYIRGRKKGEPDIYPDNNPDKPRTGLTRTDSVFEKENPNYYNYGEEIKERNCFTCGKDFTTRLALLKFCSPKCETKALDDLNKELISKGLPPTIRGSEMPKIEFVSSGIKEIDEMTGGFPRNRVSEVFGLKGVGKTQLMTRIIESLPDLRIYYVDTENALSFPPDNVHILNEYILEKVEEGVSSALTKGYDLIVVDSIASMVPRAEVEGDAGDAHMGLKARLMSQWMRRVNMSLSKSGTALVFINQQRDSMNPYVPRFTPGGFAVPYAASLRLELRTTKKDRQEDGHTVHVEVEKSRVCKPYQKTKFKLKY